MSLVLDGATGTELGRRGVDLSLPLWSTRALIDAPDVLAAVHADYLAAGADAIITNTFRTHARSLARAGRGDDARALTHQAVAIARDARDRVRPDARVFGSVAPLEDCYEPEIAPDPAACRREHEAMITDLLDADVDVILLETMGVAREVVAATDAARALAGDRWMISFCARSHGPPGVLIDGHPVSELIAHVSGALAVGFNCIAAPAMAAQIPVIGAALPASTDIIAYANTGAPVGDGSWRDTDATEPERYADYAETWRDAGATIIGGCCGTGPETIRAVARRLRLQSRP